MTSFEPAGRSSHGMSGSAGPAIAKLFIYSGFGVLFLRFRMAPVPFSAERERPFRRMSPRAAFCAEISFKGSENLSIWQVRPEEVLKNSQFGWPERFRHVFCNGRRGAAARISAFVREAAHIPSGRLFCLGCFESKYIIGFNSYKIEV